MDKIFKTKEQFHLFLLVSICLVGIWSAINPYNDYMWRANFAVAVAYTLGIIAIYRKIKFSSLSLILMFIHLVIILISAKYTYENFEPFNWLRDYFGLSRNYFDRVGHFFQGFAPVMGMRDIFLRGKFMKRGKFFFFTLVMFALGISGAWELLEYIGSEIAGKSEEYFLSMQGDMWDAQKDMLICTVGAVLSLLMFSKYQDSELKDEGIE